jgi:AbrB family looped-hinge helix DNA binding protein
MKKEIAIARVTSKGQITIPKRIREILHVKEGSSVVFYESRGHIYIDDAERRLEIIKE